MLHISVAYMLEINKLSLSLALLEYEENLSFQEEQGKMWLEEYVKLLGRGNIICHSNSFLSFFRAYSGCKECRVRQPGASGFCNQASEFCA